MNPKNVLEIRDLAISFKTTAGTVNAIRGVNLDVKRAQTLAIVGESGSGKSVTVKAIAGIIATNGAVNAGNAMYAMRGADGRDEVFDLLKLSKREMRKRINGKHISIVFQDPLASLNPTMTVGAQIAESMTFHGLYTAAQARKRTLELLNMVGIDQPERRAKNYPHQLSGGMRQRVVIAIALACEPDILICDEPTTALDVTIQAKILELIKHLQRQMGISVIYITHDLGVVATVADDVAVMYAGRIIEKGGVEDIFYNPKHPYTWGLLSSMPDIDDVGDQLYTIPGNPPNLLHPVTGDAFAPRNAYAMGIDFREEPPMFKVSDTHYAATWLLHERAPKVEMPGALLARLERIRKGAK